MGIQTGEKQHEQHETVFPAVIGEGELREGIAGEGGCEDGQGGAGLVLDCGEEGVLGVGFGEEDVDSVVKVCDYGGEGLWLFFSLFFIILRILMLRYWERLRLVTLLGGVCGVVQVVALVCDAICTDVWTRARYCGHCSLFSVKTGVMVVMRWLVVVVVMLSQWREVEY